MRYVSPSLMLLGLIALPLPFLDIRCQGQSVATQSGIQAMQGQHSEKADMGAGMKPGGAQQNKKLDAAPLVMGWAGLLAVGAIAGFLMPPSSARVSLLSLLALGAAACLIAQGFVLKFPLAKEVDNFNTEMQGQLKQGMQGAQGVPGFPGGAGNPVAGQMMGQAKLEATFGLGFWLGVLAPLGAFAAALAGGSGSTAPRRPEEGGA